MTIKATFRLVALAVGSVAAAAVTVPLAGIGAAPRFYPDDPVSMERNHQDASGVQESRIDLVVDVMLHLFTRPGDPASNVRAQNLNTVDEVPDSSWFTNRLGARTITAAEMARGPDTTNGPAPGKWTVSSKANGVSPGFTILDATGQRWFIKFDPRGYRGMATGTEVTVTKLLWALGYYVPENYVTSMRFEQLVIGEGSMFTPPGGGPRPMQQSDLARVLEQVHREPDGSYRIVASRALSGKPLQGFRFYGTRPDDPNDIVPHEHRRELRGYGVFAAWLNHVDAKAINTFDTLITEGGRSFVRHHLLDFGSALGSASVAPREHWEGYEYLVEPGDTWSQMIGFGFRFPEWHTLDFYEAPSIGRLPRDNTRFDPEQWKPRVPNPAFLRARGDDKFWAAQKLAALTDDLLREAVRAGQFGDPQSEEFLATALAARRDQIVRTYLPAVNPVGNATLDNSGVLTFRNIAVDAGVAAAPAGYRAEWSAFDNATGEVRAIGSTAGTVSPLRAPPALAGNMSEFIRVAISATGGPNQSWARPVYAYFRRGGAAWRLVGFERQPD
jgi:hypothetical protein